MSYEISLAKGEKYIIVRLRANITRELAVRFSQAAYRLGAEQNLNRYLFDVRGFSNIESVFANYDYVNLDKAQLEFARPARAAILVTAGDQSHDFAVTVNRNAGFNFKLFTKEEEAVAWLEGT